MPVVRPHSSARIVTLRPSSLPARASRRAFLTPTVRANGNSSDPGRRSPAGAAGRGEWRTPSLTLCVWMVALAVLTGCQSAGSTVPTIVRVENHQVRPPSYFGFINESHPDYPTNADVPPRHKVVPDDMMDEVLSLLDDRDFDADAHTVAVSSDEVAALPILRRIVRVRGEDSRALVVPRQPDPALAQKFSDMARELGRLFNQVNYLRHEKDMKDPDLFQKEQERLDEASDRRTGKTQR